MKTLVFACIALALPHIAWGQLYTFRTNFSGANEVPPRATPASGSGLASFDVSSSLFELDYSFAGLLGPQTGAHIHLAPPGVNGPIIFDLGLGSPKSFSTLLSELEAGQLLGNEWYINVHSTVFPGGEIRAQFVPIPEPSTYALAAAVMLGAIVLMKRRSRTLGRGVA